MRAPIALSKSKLLSLAQCPRRLWLETYNPELEEPSGETLAKRAVGDAVGALARQIYGQGAGALVSYERGQRAAVEQTRALLAAGGSEPIFEAAFERDGVHVRVDVLDRSGARPRFVEVKSSASVKQHHLDDCAIQAWVLAGAGLSDLSAVVATIDSSFVYAGDGRYDGLLVETDVTADVRERLAAVSASVVEARRVLATLDEPDVAVDTHCGTPHGCEFYAHCAPPAGEYPVLALRGTKEKLFALLHAGYRDLRDVPENELANDVQRRIWRQTRLGRPLVEPELGVFVRGLPFPRYYLDFETADFAVPIFAGTRPYEALPFQWSCHVESAPGALEHREFLALDGAAPMRGVAESLVAALGTAGPIVVYTPYEKRILGELAARFGDLAEPLTALAARVVDLHPPLKRHYYHPAMRGSWSIKAVLPTVAPDLRYDALDSVRDGLGARDAYVEAIAPTTTAARRAALRRALLDYCRLDTLALARLVEFLSRAA